MYGSPLASAASSSAATTRPSSCVADSVWRCAYSALQLKHALCHNEAGILTEVHGCRPGVIAAPVDSDVGVNVACYGVDHAYPILRVLENARLLDVKLDPTDEVVEHAD